MANHPNGQRGKCCRRTCCLIHRAGSCWWQAHLSHKAVTPTTLASVSLSVSIPCFFLLLSACLRLFFLFLSLHLSVPGILWVLSAVQNIREGGSSHTLKTATSWNIHRFSVERYVCVVSRQCVCVYLRVQCTFSLPAALNCSTSLFKVHKGRATSYLCVLQALRRVNIKRFSCAVETGPVCRWCTVLLSGCQLNIMTNTYSFLQLWTSAVCSDWCSYRVYDALTKNFGVIASL